ncbi:hypothetical protein [Ktedonospora formicarum]|uniref:Uncharacterized protein n=1 Tax=Ktedonospora formicarum TaxID=2778364 RepID=A0A8J3HZP2_9CHLR|nr:hypothetical protein [Ktedonospora formicarum]GHO47207.1 hypothetical protein KSX_53700 [Ktedonospora formicarum]
MKRPKDEAHPINAALDTVTAVRDEVREIADTILNHILRGVDYTCDDTPDYIYEVITTEYTVKFQVKSVVGGLIFAALKTNSALKKGGVKLTLGR